MEPFVCSPQGKTDGRESARSLTKRERFAETFAAAIIGNADSMKAVAELATQKYDRRADLVIAKLATEYADALIKTLNK